MNATDVNVEAASLIGFLSDMHAENGTEDGYDCGDILVRAIESAARYMDGDDRETALALAESVREITTARAFISTEPEWGTPGFTPAILTALHNLGAA